MKKFKEYFEEAVKNNFSIKTTLYNHILHYVEQGIKNGTYKVNDLYHAAQDCAYEFTEDIWDDINTRKDLSKLQKTQCLSYFRELLTDTDLKSSEGEYREIANYYYLKNKIKPGDIQTGLDLLDI